MTKFNIQTTDLRYIMSAIRPAVAKTDCKPCHEYIKFTCSYGALTACGIDGYRMHSVSVHIDITDGESSFVFLLRPFTVPRVSSDFIPCELTDKEILFNFGDMKITYRLGEGIECFIDPEAVLPKEPPVLRIGLNPKFLAEAAKSLKCDDRTTAILELRNPLQPAILYCEKDKSDFRLICPVRMRSDEGWGTAFPERNADA